MEFGRVEVTQFTSCSVSTVLLKVLPVSSRTISNETKKNALSRLIGPPKLAPKSLRWKSGLGIARLSKYPRARRFWLRWN